MTSPVPAEPATPAEALRWAAERISDRLTVSPDIAAHAVTAWLKVWARDLDAARSTGSGPALTTYALPAEPPPEVAELWDSDGWHLRRQGDVWVSIDPVRESLPWRAAVYLAVGPLASAPPEAGQ